MFLQSYSTILETTPAPTVLPPSLIANLVPSSIATGAINSTVNFASPLIFNMDTNKMGQVILENADNYSLTDVLANYLEESE